MKRTTLYLKEETDLALKRMAHKTGRSQAELMREALEKLVASEERSIPSWVGIVDSGGLDIPERDEELLWADEKWP